MSTVKCEGCGAEGTSDSLFCHKCGEKLSQPEATDERPSSDGDDHAQQRFSSAAREKVAASDDVDDEEDLWEGNYSAKAMYGSWLGAFVLTIACGIAAIFVPVMGVIGFAVFVVVCWGWLGILYGVRKLGVQYKLTTQRFIHRSGILKQVTDRIEVIDMDDVTYEQGIIQRMLGVGTIRITSSDRSHPELVLRGIDDVQRVATLIDDIRRKERRRRGLHIEAI